MKQKRWYTGCSFEAALGDSIGFETLLAAPNVGFDAAGYARSDETDYREPCSYDATLSARPPRSSARDHRDTLHRNGHSDREMWPKAALVAQCHSRYFSLPSPEISCIIVHARDVRVKRRPRFR
jgi:hypothetical protein